MEPDNTEMTAHGFRAMARTIMVEQMDVEPDVIEAQLAHGKSGPLGAAYDRAEFVVKRRKMMQLWADHLDELRQGGIMPHGPPPTRGRTRPHRLAE